MYETNPLKLTNMDVIKSISLRLVWIGKHEEKIIYASMGCKQSVLLLFTSFFQATLS